MPEEDFEDPSGLQDQEDALRLLEQEAIDDPDVIVLDEHPDPDFNAPHGINQPGEMDVQDDAESITD